MKPIIVAPALSEAWFAARSTGIGASEVAIAAGLSPYQTPLELYSRKRGELPPLEETDPMRLGKLLEPVVKAEFCRSEKIVFADPDPPMYRHAEHAPILATPDAIIDSSTLFEAKTASWRMKGEWGDQGTDSAPSQYLCQCQMQMEVLDADLVHLAVLFDGADLKKFKVLRNDELIRLLIEASLELWDRIQTGRPPEPTWGHSSTHSLIRHIHKKIRNHARVMLSERACNARAEYDSLAKQAKDIKKRMEYCQEIYESEIGNCYAGVLNDGRMIRRAWIEGGHREFDVDGRFDYRAVKYDDVRPITLEEALALDQADRNHDTCVMQAENFLAAHGYKLRDESDAGSRYYAALDRPVVRVSDHEPDEKTANWIANDGVIDLRTGDPAKFAEQLAAEEKTLTERAMV